MTTDYNTIAQEYKRSKEQPWRKHVECFTLFELAGDLTGKSVLDLACGEGYYTRQVRQRGAARAVGVDLSERMVQLARSQETAAPLGVEYVVGDARGLDLGERFDLVTAGYLLNYAATEAELLAMCQVIARHLRPGGRFVTVNNNSDQPPESFDQDRPYGFVKHLVGELREGAPINYTFFLDEGPFEITNYYLSVATHERAFQAAGLRDVRWHPPRVSAEGLASFGQDFWRAFLEQPPVLFIECAR